MKLFGVTGKPIAHSLSPVLFRSAFPDSDDAYLRLVADSAKEALALSREIGLAGLNVTSPFKEDIVPLLDEIDASARAVGAVNTVVFQDTKILGFNTDSDGVRALLKKAGPIDASESVAVLGAGGAARAVLHVLNSLDVHNIAFINRSKPRAEAIRRRFGVRHVQWNKAQPVVSAADVVISCLPANVSVPAGWLNPKQRVLDATYHGGAVGQEAREANCRVFDGLPWLIGQAEAGFARMTGKAPQLDQIEPIHEKTGNTPLFLAGLSGTGKTMVGRRLAALLEWKFIDTDEEIVRNSEKTIARIFEEEGEASFRSWERETVLTVLDKQNTVISLGGGALLDENLAAEVKSSGFVVWLWATPEECASRITGNDRPLLVGGDSASRLTELLRKRRDGYARVADLVIDTGSRKPEVVAGRIADEIDRI